MKLFLLAIIVTFCIFAEAKNKTAYLDPDSKIVSVFNEPGFDWQSCKQPCEAVAWPGPDAQFSVTQDTPQVFKRKDRYTGETTEVKYVKVLVTYDRDGVKREKYGWIDESYLQYEKAESFYQAPSQSSAQKTNCGRKEETKKSKEHAADIARKQKEALLEAKIDKDAGKIEEAVGKCVRPSADASPKNGFDDLVKPTLRGVAAKNKSVTDENGHPISDDQVATISALARTLYGEMAGCFRRGLQYPMAVARIAVERAEETRRHGEFIKTGHSETDHPVCQVITTPSQFNNWMPRIDGDVNGAFLHTLCPPSKHGEKFWANANPSDEELNIWKNAVRIATDATMFPAHFKGITKALDNVFFYTSGQKHLRSFQKQPPYHTKLDGRPLNNINCIQLWAKKK